MNKVLLVFIVSLYACTAFSMQQPAEPQQKKCKKTAEKPAPKPVTAQEAQPAVTQYKVDIERDGTFACPFCEEKGLEDLFLTHHLKKCTKQPKDKNWLIKLSYIFDGDHIRMHWRLTPNGPCYFCSLCDYGNTNKVETVVHIRENHKEEIKVTHHHNHDTSKQSTDKGHPHKHEKSSSSKKRPAEDQSETEQEPAPKIRKLAVQQPSTKALVQPPTPAATEEIVQAEDQPQAAQQSEPTNDSAAASTPEIKYPVTIQQNGSHTCPFGCGADGLTDFKHVSYLCRKRPPTSNWFMEVHYEDRPGHHVLHWRKTAGDKCGKYYCPFSMQKNNPCPCKGALNKDKIFNHLRDKHQNDTQPQQQSKKQTASTTTISRIAPTDRKYTLVLKKDNTFVCPFCGQKEITNLNHFSIGCKQLPDDPYWYIAIPYPIHGTHVYVHWKKGLQGHSSYYCPHCNQSDKNGDREFIAQHIFSKHPLPEEAANSAIKKYTLEITEDGFYKCPRCHYIGPANFLHVSKCLAPLTFPWYIEQTIKHYGHNITLYWKRETSGPALFYCPYCKGYSYADKNKVINHILQKHKDAQEDAHAKTFVPGAPAKSSQPATVIKDTGTLEPNGELKYTVRVHDDGSFTCPFCQEIIATKCGKNNNIHLQHIAKCQIVHSSEDKPWFIEVPVFYNGTPITLYWKRVAGARGYYYCPYCKKMENESKYKVALHVASKRCRKKEESMEQDDESSLSAGSTTVTEVEMPDAHSMEETDTQVMPQSESTSITHEESETAAPQQQPAVVQSIIVPAAQELTPHQPVIEPAPSGNPLSSTVASPADDIMTPQPVTVTAPVARPSAVAIHVALQIACKLLKASQTFNLATSESTFACETEGCIDGTIRDKINYFIDHLLSHTTLKPFSCKACNQFKMYTLAGLTDHIHATHQRTPTEEDFSEITKYKEQIRKLVELKVRNEIACPACKQQQHSSFEELQRHWQNCGTAGH